ncbi:hypothetical protein [Cyclobacterium xiamenense]|uniref:hypothetical protein n=1 Tax=Cyclobacterium xiamenense TaxID=1297121 RepID=UPI0035D1035A
MKYQSKTAFFKGEIPFFPCQYFTQELEKMYATHTADIEIVASILEQLKTLGCLDTDPAMKMIQAQYDMLQAVVKPETERDPLSNSEVDQAIQEGNYPEAEQLLKIAVEEEPDSFKNGRLLFQLAHLQYKELRLIEEARNNAIRAAELASNFGKPYLLLGDIYLIMSRNCGESWQERLAAIAAMEKYEHARNIDTSVVMEANRRIVNLKGALPLREDGFALGVSAGDKVSVGCGIDETITVRFQ